MCWTLSNCRQVGSSHRAAVTVSNVVEEGRRWQWHISATSAYPRLALTAAGALFVFYPMSTSASPLRPSPPQTHTHTHQHTPPPLSCTQTQTGCCVSASARAARLRRLITLRSGTSGTQTWCLWRGMRGRGRGGGEGEVRGTGGAGNGGMLCVRQQPVCLCIAGVCLVWWWAGLSAATASHTLPILGLAVSFSPLHSLTLSHSLSPHRSEPSGGRLIVVANRLPVTCSKVNKWGGGGREREKG